MMTYVTSVWEKGRPKNWVEREKPVTYKELLCIVGQKLLAVCAGGAVESQVSPSQVEPVGGEDERVENENQDDGEGQDKDKIDEGDMNNKETGEAGGGGGSSMEWEPIHLVLWIS
jgi:hypothetical protein